MTLLAEASQTIERRSLHGELVERLRALITVGDLANGQKVPERALCERFGVSRTPLREALKVLASEGVVTLRQNRGAVVNGLTADELTQAFPVMGALEALSGEIACRMITDAELAKIRVAHETMVVHWRRGELQAYFALNRAIHEAILEATHNDVLISAYRNISRRIMAARYMANKSPKRWAEAVKEHEAILTALERRDGRTLSRLLKSHLANKLEALKNTLLAQETSEAGAAKERSDAARADGQRSAAQSSQASRGKSATARGNGRRSARQ
jgi:DNA-binding GntR family transcriptional regulator